MTGNLDRTRVPEPNRPLGRLAFPTFERGKLANGLEWFIAPRKGVPMVEAQLLLPAGGERSPADRPGIAALTAALVDEGTEARSGVELALELEKLGANLASGAHWDAARVEISALARDLDTALSTIDEVARQPSFPDSEVERLRRRILTEFARRPDEPALVADETFAEALYAGTVYGHLLQGTEAALQATRRDEILAFHHDGFGPEEAKLVLGGDLAIDETVARIERIFSSWRGCAPLPSPEIRPRRAAERRVLLVDIPHAAQTELRIGHPGPTRTHPDRAKLNVLNAVLGGKFTSRLMLNLRERHGFTYGVSSRFVGRRGPGPFVIGTAVSNAVAGRAVEQVLFELARIRETLIASDELEESKSYLTGVFPYTLETVGGVTARISDLALHGLPSDHFERVLEEIATTTAGELLELARRHLDPERVAIVAVGPAAVLGEQLRAYGDLEIRRPA